MKKITNRKLVFALLVSFIVYFMCYIVEGLDLSGTISEGTISEGTISEGIILEGTEPIFTSEPFFIESLEERIDECLQTQSIGCLDGILRELTFL